MREEQLQELTLKLLSRLNPPRAIIGQAKAIKDEASFLSKCISRHAPSRGLTDWFEEFEEAVLGNLETRTWPTAKELSKAAREIRKSKPVFADHSGEGEWLLDPVTINAKRIQGGHPVCETWLSGKRAKSLLATGMVCEADINRYKKTIRFQKSIWGKKSGEFDE